MLSTTHQLQTFRGHWRSRFPVQTLARCRWCHESLYWIRCRAPARCWCSCPEPWRGACTSPSPPCPASLWRGYLPTSRRPGTTCRHRLPWGRTSRCLLLCPCLSAAGNETDPGEWIRRCHVGDIVISQSNVCIAYFENIMSVHAQAAIIRNNQNGEGANRKRRKEGVSLLINPLDNYLSRYKHSMLDQCSISGTRSVNWAGTLHIDLQGLFQAVC